MNVLVVNCGSSSLKVDVLDPDAGTRSLSAKAERLGTPDAMVRIGEEAMAIPGADHAAALAKILPSIEGEIDAVGHRVVHGGERFNKPTRVTDAVEGIIAELVPLAPLHNPANLAGIKAARAALPDAVHVAVFDTAFHQTLPTRARTYALPLDLQEKHGVRRFGFHGPSHHWVARQTASHLDTDLQDLRVITCHLGNGASVTAVEYGRSVETSMGMTPLEGLVMGTRAGDVDAGVVLEIMRREGLDVDAMDALLNTQSGLAGLSGVGNDLRDIEARAADGDDACRLAIHVFCHRLRKYIGAYAAVMGGVDAVVFTAGIGENSALIRHRVAQRLDFLGARLDEDLNRDAQVSDADPVAEISSRNSRVRLLVVRTDEARAIATDAADLARQKDAVEDPGTVPIAVSARHIHLTQEHVEALFGPGHTLTVKKPLTQPGQFAAEERVTLIGPKRSIPKVRVLGPIRGQTQVEIARTDEFTLGIDAPVRRSGDLDNTPGITLEGPYGRVTLKQGVICAWRHIHMTPEDAVRFGVEHRDIVDVAVDSEGRDLVFGDVMVRVSPKYALEMHIDTDEANAAEIARDTPGVLLHTDRTGHLLSKRSRR